MEWRKPDLIVPKSLETRVCYKASKFITPVSREFFDLCADFSKKCVKKRRKSGFFFFVKIFYTEIITVFDSGIWDIAIRVLGGVKSGKIAGVAQTRFNRPQIA